jgi:hypothetical protein
MLTIDEHVLKQVAQQLGNYVYVLVDPRDSMPFYVGKGVGTRMLAHGVEAEHLTAVGEDLNGEVSRKIARIQEIRAAGNQPVIWVLRYGLSAAEYTAVEAAAIDLLMSLPTTPTASGPPRVPLAHADQLTNARREASRGSGITTLEQLVDDLAAPPLESETPLLLITLNSWYALKERVPGGGTRQGFGFKRAWLDNTLRRAEIDILADSTRCWWRIDPRRVEGAGIQYAVAVYGGVSRALLRIVPGSWESFAGNPKRRGFSATPVLCGDVFDEVIGPHGHRVPPKARGDQSQFNYWPRVKNDS